MMHADAVRRQKVDRFTKHSRLGLDAADAPSDDAESIDHRRVRVGTDDRVGIVDALFFDHTAREIFEIHLMDDADARRHHLKSAKRLRSPFEKLITLRVTLELD